MNIKAMSTRRPLPPMWSRRIPTGGNPGVNRRLFEAAKASGACRVLDLYGTYAGLPSTVAAAEQRLSTARLVVLMHPVQWYSMPALLKLWIDEVLAFGWAYGGGRALRGEDLWLVTTTGGPEAASRPPGLQPLRLRGLSATLRARRPAAGMRFLPPLVLHGAHSVPDANVDAHVSALQSACRPTPDGLSWTHCQRAACRPSRPPTARVTDTPSSSTPWNTHPPG
jgi:glutathione-regulated potassium-efflux system ancillary protein KefF